MKNGFTLIEILVVVSIIAIFTTILSVSFLEGRQQFALQRVAHKIIQDLRRAQEMTMSSKRETCPGEETANGFGIHFEKSSPNSYFLFANCDESYSYDKNSDDQILENIDLEKGTKIFSLSSSSLSIAFAPPSPITYVNGSLGLKPGDLLAQIVISLESDTSKIKTIKVNKAGLIELE